MEVFSGGIPVVEAAECYGVSRKTVHAWLRRYRQDGLPGLTDRSHRPHHYPGQLAAEMEARGMRAAPDPSLLGPPNYWRWGRLGLVHLW